MGDWGPTRDDAAEKKWEKYLADHKGMKRFTIKMTIGVFDPDFSDIDPVTRYGNLWLSSFGAGKGRELDSFGDWTKVSIESVVKLIQMEKSPKVITWRWENDGRKNFFTIFKGKKLSVELDIAANTPGNATALHYTLKLDNCRLTGIGQDHHKVDKTMVKFDRVYATCGNVNFKAAE